MNQTQWNFAAHFIAFVLFFLAGVLSGRFTKS